MGNGNGGGIRLRLSKVAATPAANPNWHLSVSRRERLTRLEKTGGSLFPFDDRPYVSEHNDFVAAGH